MSYEFEVREIQRRAYASSRAATTRAGIPETIAGLLHAVWEHVQKHGGMPIGPPFTRVHRDNGDDDLEIEAGIPLDQIIEGGGRIECGEDPGGEAVAVMHVGPYEGLREADAALAAWAAKNGRRPRGPNVHVYWTDPGSEPDASKWKTRVIMLLAPR